MVRNIVVLGGNSHPQLTDSICNFLGMSPCKRILTKFSVGETRCEIQGSVRGKDVYIIQTGSGKVNDALMDLLIMISALKTGSARRVTAVLPLFPYSRQPDAPYKKSDVALSKSSTMNHKGKYSFDSVPATPGPGTSRTLGFANGTDISSLMSKTSLGETNGVDKTDLNVTNVVDTSPASVSSLKGQFTTHDVENLPHVSTFQARPGYKQWVAQAGTLIADLLTCAGADHIITLYVLSQDTSSITGLRKLGPSFKTLAVVAIDLHDSQYQGFFDVPVDNLFARPLLQRYITLNIPNYKDAVVVSPDAGGAKRAIAIADALGLSFSLIHKERRPTKISERQHASMILVGDVSDRVCILIDDLIDTGKTITRAAKLLKKEGATAVFALVTHGVLSGDAMERIQQGAIDKIVTTNSVPQDENKSQLGAKLDVLDVSHMLAEAIRRSHHGESLSSLFQYT